MTTKQGPGEPNPTWIPAGNDVTRRVADKIDGIAGGNVGDLISAPMTAHFVGGAPISDSPEVGVSTRISGCGATRAAHHRWLRCHCQPGRQPVADDHRTGGACIGHVAEQGRTRPAAAQGEAYRAVTPVAPKSPMVPDAAPGALRLPIVAIRQGSGGGDR